MLIRHLWQLKTIVLLHWCLICAVVLERLSYASFLGKLLVLPANVRLDWKVFARCKQSSLFGLVISYKEKSFITLTPGLNSLAGSPLTASHWSCWGQWSDCTSTCGGSGVQRRHRVCVPASGSQDVTCAGSGTNAIKNLRPQFTNFCSKLERLSLASLSSLV